MNSLKNNIIIYFILIIFCAFLSFSHSLLQVSMDSGLALSNIIKYPEPLSPMKYYYFNSWTIINQFSELLLKLGLSVEASSKLILFISSLFFALSALLIVNRITSKKYLGLFIAVLMLIFQKNLGDTDYPSLILSNHTYGMMSLAVTSFTFSLLINNYFKLSSFFLTLLICIHPIIGTWILSIAIISLIIFNEKKIRNDFIKGSIYGFAITFFSFIFFFNKNLGTINFEIQNLSSYMKNWDGHRNTLGFIHFEYLLKTAFLFLVINTYYFYKDKNKKSDFFRIFFNTSIILSTLIYFFFKLIPAVFPDIFVRLMPSRFIILHSFVAWPLILSAFYFFLKKLKKTEKIAPTLITIILIFYSAQHYKSFVKLLDGFIDNVVTKEITSNTKFFKEIKNLNTSGYFITSSQKTNFTHIISEKPVLLDVKSFDFIPYHPYLIDNVFQILQDIYGVDINSPPIKSNPSIPDSFIKKNFENKLKTEWVLLSNKYNANYVVVPSDWTIKLDLLKKNTSFAVYKIQ